MEHPSFLDRVRGGIRRVLFWLPSSSPNEEVPTEIHHHDHALVISVTEPERVPKLRQLRHILKFLTPSEAKLFLLASIVFCLAIGTAATAFAFDRIVTVPVVGGTFTEAVVGEPKYLNPLDAPLNDVDRDLVQLVYSGLFRFRDFDTIPDLAEDYAWSNDGKTLTVHIRDDARFQDGVPVTSDDVRFTIENAQDPARKSPLQEAFRNIKVSVPDDTTVVFDLPQPDPQFLAKLTVGILPAHAWQDVPAANARLSDINIRPIGSGPYRVKSFMRDNLGAIHSYTLERFDQFYGTKPFIKTVIFQFFVDQPTAVDALKADLVDAAAFITTDVQNLTSSGRKHDATIELPQETVAFFNLKNPTLAVKDVRQALALAVNRQEIVAAQDGSAEIVSGPYPFGAVSSTTQNLEAARTLLTNAGWILPQNGDVRVWKTKSGAATSTEAATELALTISFPADPKLTAVAESLKRSWSLLGIRVTLEPLATDDLVRRATRGRDTQITLLSILLGPDQDLFPFWWSGQAVDRGFNISNLKDKTVDDALQATRAATSTAALYAAREKASEAILSSTPAVFLSRPTQHYIVSSNIQGVTRSIKAVTPAERFEDIEHWYIKTGWRWK